ncbi:MAG: hypothetical protein ACUVSY_18750, partial [Roseiflexus sp.]
KQSLPARGDRSATGGKKEMVRGIPGHRRRRDIHGYPWLSMAKVTPEAMTCRDTPDSAAFLS